jgi:hypothetical protein
MERIRVKENSAGRLQVEVVPVHARLFWVLWSVTVIASATLGWYQLGRFQLLTLPLWLLWAAVSAALLLKGWVALTWQRKGGETISVRDGELSYERQGSAMDRRKVQLKWDQGSTIEIVNTSFGDNLEPNRLRVTSRGKTLNFGRNLSEPEAEQLSRLLRESQQADTPR